MVYSDMEREITGAERIGCHCKHMTLCFLELLETAIPLWKICVCVFSSTVLGLQICLVVFIGVRFCVGEIRKA